MSAFEEMKTSAIREEIEALGIDGQNILNHAQVHNRLLNDSEKETLHQIVAKARELQKEITRRIEIAREQKHWHNVLVPFLPSL